MMKSSDEETRYIINCDIFSYWWCRPDFVTQVNSMGKYFPNKFLQWADLISDWKEETGRCLACGRKVSPDMILFSVSYRGEISWQRQQQRWQLVTAWCAFWQIEFDILYHFPLSVNHFICICCQLLAVTLWKLKDYQSLSGDSQFEFDQDRNDDSKVIGTTQIVWGP